jgi:hypothetical protein
VVGFSAPTVGIHDTPTHHGGATGDSFHGNAFEYFRDKSLNTKNHFEQADRS